MNFQIHDNTRKYLLTLAKQSICSQFGMHIEIVKDTDIIDDLSVEVGAFVTLYKRGMLRGCIGFIEGVAPIEETVKQLAKMSAFEDNRFPPVTRDEVDELEIEITILSPLMPAKADEIVVGRDGLFITYGNHRGVLLPQVAAEYGWTREEFLSQTCMKAGLPKNAYHNENVTIERFEAFIFNNKVVQ